MTASKADVLYALLALDGYNRSENKDLRGIETKDNKSISDQIGGAIWVNSSDKMQKEPNSPLAGSTTSGFSASYYTVDTETVISYRGTDFPTSLSWSQISEFIKDFGTGWLASINVLNPKGFDPFLIGKYGNYRDSAQNSTNWNPIALCGRSPASHRDRTAGRPPRSHHAAP